MENGQMYPSLQQAQQGDENLAMSTAATSKNHKTVSLIQYIVFIHIHTESGILSKQTNKKHEQWA